MQQETCCFDLARILSNEKPTLQKKIHNASNGARFAWKNKSNFHTHIALGLLTLGFFLFVQPTLIWWALIVLCIALVIAAELTNSALEALADHLHPEIHPAVGAAKNMMAAMAFIMSLAAALFALLDTMA